MNASKARTGDPPGRSEGVSRYARQVVHGTQEVSTALRAAADDVQRYLADQARCRPYSTLAVAAGVGYVLGGGLRTQLTGLLFGIGSRLAIAIVAREISDSQAS